MLLWNLKKLNTNCLLKTSLEKDAKLFSLIICLNEESYKYLLKRNPHHYRRRRIKEF